MVPFALAIATDVLPLAILAGVDRCFALYRAGLFIHEITHLKPAHFRTSDWRGTRWSASLVLPSFMYEGIHNMHPRQIRYGTVEDPEYLPLALMKP